MLRKIMAYRKAIIEVYDDGETYISAVPWRIFITSKIAEFFNMIDYGRPFHTQLLFPWEWIDTRE